jgi:aspartate carbamoyltransferase catalytic subunit
MRNMTWDRRHLLQLEGMAAEDILAILEQAERWRAIAMGQAPRLDLLAGRTIANLFFEDSTRTRSSFTLAARRLGADTLDLAAAGSSVSKGETMTDTALNLQAMGVAAFVVRCKEAGVPHMLAKAVQIPVLNAGDGRHEHPTQGLLDIMTLRHRLGPDLKGRTIAIVGDIVNSRVARSAIHGLTTLGANVVLCGPPTLVPKSFESIVNSAAVGGRGKIKVDHDLDSMLPALDAIMMLRVQFERAGGGPSLISGDYHALYGLTAQRAARLSEHAVVLHPGPVNRGLELDSEVMDDTSSPHGRSAILQQVSNGVAVRMAAMAMLLAGAST